MHGCDPSKRSTCHVVEKEAHMEKCKEPTVSRGTRPIQKNVSHALGILIASFSWVLMVLARFALPITNGTVAEDIVNTLADFGLGPVADELGGSTTLPIAL